MCNHHNNSDSCWETKCLRQISSSNEAIAVLRLLQSWFHGKWNQTVIGFDLLPLFFLSTFGLLPTLWGLLPHLDFVLLSIWGQTILNWLTAVTSCLINWWYGSTPSFVCEPLLCYSSRTQLRLRSAPELWPESAYRLTVKPIRRSCKSIQTHVRSEERDKG